MDECSAWTFKRNKQKKKMYKKNFKKKLVLSTPGALPQQTEAVAGALREGCGHRELHGEASINPLIHSFIRDCLIIEYPVHIVRSTEHRRLYA